MARAELRLSQDSRNKVEQQIHALREAPAQAVARGVAEALTQELCDLRCQLEERTLLQRLQKLEHAEGQARQMLIERHKDRLVVERLLARRDAARQRRAERQQQSALDERSARRARPI